jgi:hypothetical protein
VGLRIVAMANDPLRKRVANLHDADLQRARTRHGYSLRKYNVAVTNRQQRETEFKPFSRAMVCLWRWRPLSR